MLPHRWQPTRLPCPWDSPGKNTGVGCHFLLQCMKVKSESEVTQLCPTLSDPKDCSPPGSSIHGIFLYQTANRLPVANEDFLGFWTVDNCQEGHSQRSDPRRDTRHTWEGCTHCHPGNPAAGTGEVIRCTLYLGRLCSPSAWSPELLGPGKDTKRRPNRVCAFVEYPRTWTWLA